MNPVTTSDIADLWRPMTEQETRRCQLKLAGAWAELTRRVPNFLYRVNSGDIPAGLLQSVIGSAVEDVMRNPDKFVEVSVDDFRGRRSEAGSKSKYLFSDEDLDLLAPDEDDSQSFSIAPGYC